MMASGLRAGPCRHSGDAVAGTYHPGCFRRRLLYRLVVSEPYAPTRCQEPRSAHPATSATEDRAGAPHIPGDRRPGIFLLGSARRGAWFRLGRLAPRRARTPAPSRLSGALAACRYHRRSRTLSRAATVQARAMRRCDHCSKTHSAKYSVTAYQLCAKGVIANLPPMVVLQP